MHTSDRSRSIFGRSCRSYSCCRCNMLSESCIVQIPPGKHVRKSLGIQMPLLVGKHDLGRANRVCQGSVCPRRSRSSNGDLICSMCGSLHAAVSVPQSWSPRKMSWSAHFETAQLSAPVREYHTCDLLNVQSGCFIAPGLRTRATPPPLAPV
ncbi:unnamed protein product [Laminaria digitata]